MANDRHDDDVIVISEEEVRYEDADENGDLADRDQPDRRGTSAVLADEPAEGDLAENDRSTRDVPSTAGRFGPATPGDTAAAGTTGAGTARPAADAADAADATDPEDHPVTQPVSPAAGTRDVNGNGDGSAIPVPGAAAPAASAASGTPVAGHDESDANWPQIQALFVDDPLAAVQQAADVAGGALAALLAAANNREQTLRGSWEGGDSIGTEDLRNALREYRELAGRLSTLSRDF